MDCQKLFLDVAPPNSQLPCVLVIAVAIAFDSTLEASLLRERAGSLSSSMRLLRSTYPPQPTSPWPLAPLPLLLAFTAALLTQHAFAAPEDPITHEDHNHPQLKTALGVGVGHDIERYEPEFAGADRSIIGRTGEVSPALGNNAPGILNINQGASQYWTFPSATLFGPNSPQTPGLPSYFEGQNVSVTPDDPGEIELYISLTTCQQPLANDPNPNGAPDQLKLYVSISSNNQQPNLNNSDYAVPVDGGFGWLNISVKNDVYFGIYAPENDGYDGVYNYQLTASIDGFYASSYSDPNVDIIDSDTNSALLYTKNTTSTTNTSNSTFQQWMNSPPVFSLFVQNQDNPSILGLQNSVCGLQSLAQIQGLPDVETAMTAAGNGLPKQQFYVKNLNGSSTYYAITAMVGNSTDHGPGVVGGGGTVWNSANITTKSFDNCALLFNLSFCTSVAYAAPANPQTFNTTELLAQQYDNYTKTLYQNFVYSLQQIPCNTTSSAQYSLARNCDDCDAAYRQWLCAVTIPRCEDFSNPDPHLQPRATNYSLINSSYANGTDGDPAFSTKNRNRTAFNSSRNPWIDAVIQPGPYKERLPCKDICYDLIRSCPAALQFACPLEGHGLNYSYGSHKTGCNSPWMGISGAAGLRMTGFVALFVALAAAFMATTL